MLPSPPRLSVEPEMNQFIRTVGGELVSTIIGTKNPRFANADYVFRQDNVIAELKCLSENKDTDVNQRAEIAALFKRYHDAGKIPYLWGVRAINSADCPVDLQKELSRILARPIRRQIKKANRQIRETRRELKMDGALGLPLLANDGNFRLEPGQLMYAVDTAIGQHFSAINTLAVFTVNMSASLPLRMAGLPPHANVWIPASRIGHRKIPDEFLNRLSRGWARHVSIRLQQSIPVFEDVDHAVMNQLRYDDRTRPKPIVID